jgi:hypothetical protein
MTPLIGAALEILNKVIPDPAAKAAAQIEVLKLQQAGELKALEAEMQLAIAQTEINKVEAAAPDLFRGGWRPFVGWVGGAALAVQFIVRPLLPWGVGLFGAQVAPIPSLDMTDLMTILGGLLGLGGLRTAERLKGKA